MKIILAGCSGFIGSGVLAECLNHPKISSIIILARQPLPSTLQQTSNPKLKTILLQDFSEYPSSVLEDLKGADGCIWSIGSFTGDTAVDIEYPLAFCNAIVEIQPPGKKFTYVHLGGAFTEPPDKDRKLWYYATARRVRGKAESLVLAFAQQPDHRSHWEAHVVKPGAVLGQKSGWARSSLEWVLSLGSYLRNWVIPLDVLAAAMVGILVDGVEGNFGRNHLEGGAGGRQSGERRDGDGSKVWLNGELVDLGRELLAGERRERQG